MQQIIAPAGLVVPLRSSPQSARPVFRVSRSTFNRGASTARLAEMTHPGGDRTSPLWQRKVLRSDASRSFRLESAVLAFVTIVSAWPVAINDPRSHPALKISREPSIATQFPAMLSDTLSPAYQLAAPSWLTPVCSAEDSRLYHSLFMRELHQPGEQALKFWKEDR